MLVHYKITVCLIFVAILLPATWLFAATTDAIKHPDHLIPTQRTDLSTAEQTRVTQVTQPTNQFLQAEPFELMQGGAGTSRKLVNRDAFSHSAANLSFADEEKFKLGNALFRKLWVSSPASTHASDGLGPLFNARACQSCHLKDGRGHPPEVSRDATSMLLRLARPAQTTREQQSLRNLATLNFPDPIYGGQLQDVAVPGLAAEGQLQITYQEHPVKLSDGTIISLRRPTYRITDLVYGALGADTTLSPRIANPMIGLGLIEMIHTADILVQADPEDNNQDDISGRAAFTKHTPTGEIMLGRFGWKAQHATLRAQSAGAFAHDIGISTPDLPQHFGDCTNQQTSCLAYPTGVQQTLGNTEAPDPVLDLVTFYAQNLAVPARREVANSTVLQGKQLFYALGCAACHTPKFVTRKDAEQAHHAFQLIWPYSDFLLHDMGEGLADGQTVGMANGREWRTPPLWGIGLTKTVSGHTFFLHDGRARNLTEAILWHGGEGQPAKERFAALAKADHAALIRFLESL